MKNKKGFTLIELLAVIVILAIIALVATPIVLNMINNARKSAAKSSALGYIDAIEYNNGFAMLGSDAGVSGYTKVESGDIANINIKLKGKKPESGTVTIDPSGKITEAELCVNGYKVKYENRDVTSVTKGCDGSSESAYKPSVTNVSGATHKGIVYMNPTDLTVECSESNSQIGTGAANASGCMKFYIYDDSGDTYKMILDHNTTAKVAYNTTTPYVEYEQATIKQTVDSDTAGWKGNTGLITAQEIATITNTTTFDGSSSTYFSFSPATYSWLIDNGGSSTGYWTASPVTNNSNQSWYVYIYGGLGNNNVNDANRYGVRPVITLNKSQFN